MRFEWDDRKSRSNRRKHGFSFEVASQVFADPLCLTIVDLPSGEEERLWAIGRLRNLTLAVVVHTVSEEAGEEVIRIISARKATPRERDFYEKAQQETDPA